MGLFAAMDPEVEHAVPQNVTSFQFHLVGDMTIRQFAYLASGFVIAYLTYLIIFSISPIIAVPIIVFSVAAGFALAFVPILDRPLDHWLKAFFKAVYSPTEGYWTSPINPREKVNPNDSLFANRLFIYLTQLANPVAVTPAPVPLPALPVRAASNPVIFTPPAPIQLPARPPYQPIAAPLRPVISPPPPPPQPLPKPLPHPAMAEPHHHKLPSSQELTKLVEMAEQIQTLRQQINETEKEINELKLAATSTTTHLYEKQSAQAFENLQNLIKQTENIYQKSAALNPAPAAPKPTPNTVVFRPPKTIEKQILLTSTPNVINGVVVDKDGNFLEGVIVIIHNTDQMPVRALKTNKLGQFSGATPLPNGTYTVNLESEGVGFDTFQITLSGEVMPPLRVIAKGAAL